MMVLIFISFSSSPLRKLDLDLENLDILEESLFKTTSLLDWNSLLSKIRLKELSFFDISASFFLKKSSMVLLFSGTITSSVLISLIDEI